MLIFLHQILIEFILLGKPELVISCLGCVENMLVIPETSHLWLLAVTFQQWLWSVPPFKTCFFRWVSKHGKPSTRIWDLGWKWRSGATGLDHHSNWDRHHQCLHDAWALLCWQIHGGASRVGLIAGKIYRFDFMVWLPVDWAFFCINTPICGPFDRS